MKCARRKHEASRRALDSLHKLSVKDSRLSYAKDRVFKIPCGQLAMFAAFRRRQLVDRRAKVFDGPCSHLLIFNAQARRRTLGHCEALFRIRSRLNTLINVASLKVQCGEAG